MLELAVDVLVVDRAISEIIVMTCSPETQGLKSQPILFLLIAFNDSFDKVSDFDILEILTHGRVQFNESNIVLHLLGKFSSSSFALVDEIVEVNCMRN